MLILNNIEVKLKNEKNPILKKISLEIEKDRITFIGDLSVKDINLLNKTVSNKDIYEIKIGNIIYNNKLLKKVMNNNKLSLELISLISNISKNPNLNKIYNVEQKKIISKISTNNFEKYIEKQINTDESINEIGNKLFEKVLKKSKRYFSNDSLVIEEDECNITPEKTKITCHTLNESGFTLVELIATISILAIIMMMALPNVIGVVNKNKNKTYIEDAKKLISLTEYGIKSGKLTKPADNARICYSLEEIDTNNEFSEGPNNEKYDRHKSGVCAKNYTSCYPIYYTYNVSILEKKNNTYMGIQNKDSNTLYTYTNDKNYFEIDQSNISCYG